jgi:Cu+-exporting ATPase
MAMHKDPVCGMTVDDQRAKGQSDFGGRTFYFCAKSCKDRFDANPQQYAGKA